MFLRKKNEGKKHRKFESAREKEIQENIAGAHTINTMVPGGESRILRKAQPFAASSWAFGFSLFLPPRFPSFSSLPFSLPSGANFLTFATRCVFFSPLLRRTQCLSDYSAATIARKSWRFYYRRRSMPNAYRLHSDDVSSLSALLHLTLQLAAWKRTNFSRDISPSARTPSLELGLFSIRR